MKRILSILFVVCLGAVVAFSLAVAPAQAKTTYISIGTGGTGGVYYPYGGGLAEIWSKYVKGVKAVAEVTGASVENVKYADRGETVIGEAMNDVVFQAYKGVGKFKKPKKIYTMFCMYPNLYQIVALKKLGLKSIYDVKGKRVSIGSPGSGTAYKTNLVFGALGIAMDSFKVYRLSFNENANALKDGTIDIGVWSVAAPTSSVMDLATTHPIDILNWSAADMKKVSAKYPFYRPYVIPKGTYKGVDYDVHTLSVWNTVACWQKLPTALVYKLVKAVYEHHDYLQKIHPFARFTTPENTLKQAVIPLHPGTVKYFKEIGLKIPARLMPKK